jgi:rsbT co-antagonist protein RsbR
MGCQTIISGISPAIAQTIVELGIQIEELRTTGIMQDALVQALEITGLHISQNEVVGSK